PHHRNAAQHHRWMSQTENGARPHVDGTGAHEILRRTMSGPAGPPVLVTRAHRSQMFEIDLRIVPADRDPSVHPAAVAVDAVPHQLAHEPTDLPKAFGAIELHHADRRLIAAL